MAKCQNLSTGSNNKRVREGHEDTLIGELKLMGEAREAREVKKSKIELAIEFLLSQYQEVLTEEEIVIAIDLVSDPRKATTFLEQENLSAVSRFEAPLDIICKNIINFSSICIPACFLEPLSSVFVLNHSTRA
jgi:hypothetical protein